MIAARGLSSTSCPTEHVGGVCVCYHNHNHRCASIGRSRYGELYDMRKTRPRGRTILIGADLYLFLSAKFARVLHGWDGMGWDVSIDCGVAAFAWAGLGWVT